VKSAALLLMLLWMAACAVPPTAQVKPGTVVAIQFVQDDATVKQMALRLNPEWARQYRWLKACYWREGQLIIISAASFNPEIMAHELYWVIGAQSRTRKDIQ
jgi:uncharacterized lipoprotein YajG